MTVTLKLSDFSSFENANSTQQFSLSASGIGYIRVNSIAGIATVQKQNAGGTYIDFFTVQQGETLKEENCAKGNYQITTTGNFNFEYGS